MQETQVQFLVGDDPTCHRATKPECRTIEPTLWSPGAATTQPTCPRACALQPEKPPLCIGEQSLLTATTEKAAQQQRPRTAKNEYKKLYFLKKEARKEGRETKDHVPQFGFESQVVL